jgi:hypothetical protein
MNHSGKTNCNSYATSHEAHLENLSCAITFLYNLSAFFYVIKWKSEFNWIFKNCVIKTNEIMQIISFPYHPQLIYCKASLITTSLMAWDWFFSISNKRNTEVQGKENDDPRGIFIIDWQL